MEKVKVIAPAKINLSLGITGVDRRGYHLLDMIMQTVSLSDRVTVAKKEAGITISSSSKYIPTDSGNVAYKAAREFFSATGINGGAEIYIDKRIPVKAGMGGGSADRAGVLFGLNMLYETRLSRRQLRKIGEKAGSDVPFLVIGGTRRVRGTGEIISPCPPMPNCRIVICMPYKGVSTQAAFRAYESLTDKISVDNSSLARALEKKDLPRAASFMANALEEASKPENLAEIKSALTQSGALAALMTGSGRAIFGLFDDIEKAVAAKLRVKPFCRSVYITRPARLGPKEEKPRFDR